MMPIVVRFSSGFEYQGATYLDLVDLVRRDFDASMPLREYIRSASARAWDLGVPFGIICTKGSEEKLARKFIAEAVRVGLAEVVTLQ